MSCGLAPTTAAVGNTSVVFRFTLRCMDHWGSEACLLMCCGSSKDKTVGWKRVRGYITVFFDLPDRSVSGCMYRASERCGVQLIPGTSVFLEQPEIRHHTTLYHIRHIWILCIGAECHILPAAPPLTSLTLCCMKTCTKQ